MHPNTIAAFADELTKIAAPLSPAVRALGAAAGLGAAGGAVAGGPGNRTSGAVKGAIAAPLALHGAKHAVRYGKAIGKLAPEHGIKSVSDAVKAVGEPGGRETLKTLGAKGLEAAKKEALY